MRLKPPLRASALATLGFFFGLAAVDVPGSAQTGNDFLKGKQLSVMIGYGVGGSDDLWARLIARRIGEYIPGHPTVVPVNVPGAGSLLLEKLQFEGNQESILRCSFSSCYSAHKRDPDSSDAGRGRNRLQGG
jgi:hypothetical protein